MLITPLGQIKIYTDNIELDYKATPHTYDKPPIKEHPIAGCYRIHVPAGEYRSIRCEILFSTAPIPNTGDSGQEYLNAEFEKGMINLRIGAEDETPAFETVRTELGLEYRTRAPVPEVVFGVAWATDHEGAYDSRTWYAADPTLDK